MIRSILILLLLAAASLNVYAQVKPTAKATPAKIPAIVPIKKGTVLGDSSSVKESAVSNGKYKSEKFGIEIVFPETWIIPEENFEAAMKEKGFDLSLKAPDSLSPTARSRVNLAIKQVSILLTAYRSTPGTTDNAIIRISAENLSANPQIRDAVDYFDAMRATFKSLKLPPDFTYSETQAEKLGPKQFAFIDTTSKEGKKRMYATVRLGYAILFTLSYSNDDDLATMRRILEEGNFELKKP